MSVNLDLMILLGLFFVPYACLKSPSCLSLSYRCHMHLDVFRQECLRSKVQIQSIYTNIIQYVVTQVKYTSPFQIYVEQSSRGIINHVTVSLFKRVNVYNQTLHVWVLRACIYFLYVFGYVKWNTHQTK